MGWIDSASEISTAEVADRLGFEVRRGPSASHCACPACGSERRHAKRRDRRGAIGIPHATGGFRCFECDASGDAIDFVSYVLGSQRFRDLPDDRKAEVKAWFTGNAAPSVGVDRPRKQPVRLPAAFECAEVVYPPIGEVEALWAACNPIADDQQVTDYVAYRGIDVGELEWAAECGVAKALPRQVVVPGWASVAGKPWTETGHRLIVPMYDRYGVMRTVLARSIERAPALKSSAPYGYQRRGLVMAGPLAQIMLRVGSGAHLHQERPFTLSVREGEIDFLTAFAAGEDGDDSDGKRYTAHRGLIGIASGSWTRDIAQRVPGGSLVAIRTHDDEAGAAYADKIAESLGQRVTIRRALVPNG